jgi:hypothetical protein
MKYKSYITIIAAIFLIAIAASVTSDTPDFVSETQNEETISNVPTPDITQLDIGEMFVYDFGTIKLHAYNSNDYIADQVFLLESNNELILIELLPFYDNIEEFANYVLELGKPLTSVIIAYHPAGADAHQHTKMYASQGLGEAALVPIFAEQFGEIFNDSMPETYELVRSGEMTISGVEFNVIQTDSAFDLEIPEINVYFTHMVGKNTHNILPSIDAIDGMIAWMKNIQSKNYDLILSGHDIPRTIEISAEKIAYLEKTKEFALSSIDAEAFIQVMNNAFPNYYGENYLEMSAEALFAVPSN